MTIHPVATTESRVTFEQSGLFAAHNSNLGSLTPVLHRFPRAICISPRALRAHVPARRSGLPGPRHLPPGRTIGQQGKGKGAIVTRSPHRYGRSGPRQIALAPSRILSIDAPVVEVSHQCLFIGNGQNLGAFDRLRQLPTQLAIVGRVGAGIGDRVGEKGTLALRRLSRPPSFARAGSQIRLLTRSLRIVLVFTGLQQLGIPTFCSHYRVGRR